MILGWKRAILALAWMGCSAGAAHADRIKNPTGVFSGLDKITGRIVSFEVGLNETVQFGSLQMTMKVCYTKPSTESPNTTSFVEVDDLGLDGHAKRLFSGWMFASSPGLHGIEHPVYDIWLVDCKGGTEVIAEPKEAPEDQPLPAQQPSQPPAQPAPAQPSRIIAPPAMNQPGAAPAQPAQRRQPRPAPSPDAPLINSNR